MVYVAIFRYVNLAPLPHYMYRCHKKYYLPHLNFSKKKGQQCIKKLNIPSSPWLLRLNILTCMTNSMSKATSSSFFTFVVFSRGRPRISNHEEAAVENVEAVQNTAAVFEALVRAGIAQTTNQQKIADLKKNCFHI